METRWRTRANNSALPVSMEVDGGAPQGEATLFGESPVPVPVEEAPNMWGGNEFVCSICTSDLEDGQRVARLSCRHCYHAECWNEASTRIEFCPNCRVPARLAAVWIFIAARPGASETQGQPNLIGSQEGNEFALNTPTISDDGTRVRHAKGAPIPHGRIVS